MIRKQFAFNTRVFLIVIVTISIVSALEPLISDRTMAESLHLPIVVVTMIIAYGLMKRIIFPTFLSPFLYPIWNTLIFTSFALVYFLTDELLVEQLPLSSWNNLWIVGVVFGGLAVMIWIFTLLDQKRLKKWTPLESEKPILISTKARSQYLSSNQPAQSGRFILQQDTLWFIPIIGSNIKMELSDIENLCIEKQYVYLLPIINITNKEGETFAFTTGFPFHWKKMISRLMTSQ